jgi:hypothetical protein
MPPSSVTGVDGLAVPEVLATTRGHDAVISTQ